MTFHDLNLNNPLLNALEDLGLTTPTAIQQKSFSPIMAGKDVLGIAQTGTGKTYAYLLPLIRQWQFSKKKTPLVLILVPTKELVEQVADDFRKLAKYTNLVIVGAYGGTNINTQKVALAAGADVVVGTPGRVNDLILNGSIAANLIKKVVIDEVDQMLNLGFRTPLLHLLDLLPIRKQTLMFSATITEEVDNLISENFNLLLRIEDAQTGTPVSAIEQMAFDIPNFNTKLNLLEYLLEKDRTMTKVLVFAGNKRLADRVFSQLEFKFPEEVAVTHANKSANTRLKTIEQFESGEHRILVASDMIARGLDVSEVTHVINLNVPEVPEDYMHRVGRTGRANNAGVAITFYTESEKANLGAIEELMGIKIPVRPLPEGVEVSTMLIPDEEVNTPGMKFIKVKQPKVENKGAAFHEKKDKNKKVPIKVTRADKMKLKYGKNYSSQHGGKK